LIAPVVIGCTTPRSDSGRENVQSRSLAVGIADNDTGKPVGGGEDYNDWVVEINETVHDARGLRAALATAAKFSPFDYVIYVDDSAVIDLTDRDSNGNPKQDEITPLELPAGVTLASGRGKNGSLG